MMILFRICLVVFLTAVATLAIYILGYSFGHRDGYGEGLLDGRRRGMLDLFFAIVGKEQPKP